MKINIGISLINNNNLSYGYVSAKQNGRNNVIGNSTQVISKSGAKCMQSYAIPDNQISFGKRIENHRSWGANVEKTDADGVQTVNFKVWAPYADKVVVEVRNPEDVVSLTPEQRKDKHLKDNWAGNWHVDADVNDDKSIIIPLEKCKDNVFKAGAEIPFPNGMYRYILLDKDDKVISKTKDPVAKAQPHIFSWSQIYDEKAFKWTDDDWVNGNNSAKVSDLTRHPKYLLDSAGLSATDKNGNPLMKPSNLIVRQINIPTFTEEGSIEAATKELDKIADEGIFNGVLLMPVEGTYGENWGYDGVDKYAVSRGVAGENSKDNAIARNDALKAFVNYAHSKNLNVGMDWVPSHIFNEGPTYSDAKQQGITHEEGKELSGDTLAKFGPYELQGKWGGSQFNLEDGDLATRSRVRDYVVNMPLNWIDNYHIDFIRADQTPEMHSNYTMKQVAQEVRYHFPHTVIHWEDHRTSDGLTRDLTPEEVPYNDLSAHRKAISKTEADDVSLYNIGGNEHWDFAFSHSIEALLLNKTIMGYNPSVYTLVDNIKDIGGTKYFMSHDEIGNDNGTRLMTKVINKDLDIDHHLSYKDGENSAQRRIRGLDTIQDLFAAYEFDKDNWDEKFDEISEKNGLKGITKKQFENEAERAKDKHKQAIGLLFMVPGSKMIFQGDAYGEINPFRFTRNQAVDEPNLEEEKGYDFKEAFKESKIDPEHHTIYGIHRLSHVMSRLVKRNPALQDVQAMDKLDAMVPLVDDNNKVIAIKRFNDKGNSVIAFYNFGGDNLKNYHLNNSSEIFGNDDWEETINSNDIRYGGSGKCRNSRYEKFAVDKNVDINIPANGFVILEKARENKQT